MTKNQFQKIQELYTLKYGEKPDECHLLPPSGSYRRYYRMRGAQNCMGVMNEDIKENKAFLSFSRSFKSIDIPVPDIILESENGKSYLTNDLGNDTLFDYLNKLPEREDIISIYEKVIDYLLIIQFKGREVIDFNKCYPREIFDAQSVRWDLNYFKYNFIKFLQITFDEQLLENDFNTLVNYIESLPADYFLYRDFQSSNIMYHEGELSFIDYQGGRKGSFYYDIASLLYDAKANLGNDVRDHLKNYYFNKLQQYEKTEKTDFESGFAIFALIRIMQAMGAYGFRGLFEKKPQFIKSIPLAINNLKDVVHHLPLPFEVPELLSVFNFLFDHPLAKNKISKGQKLKVRVNSFSYRKSIPMDFTGNGGGFVFDCRGLPNPGRYPEYRAVTGMDNEVIAFFKDKSEVHNFLNKVFDIIDITIQDYLKRKRNDLQINFGCTGGQHRSVYCAENMAKHLQKFDLDIELKHFEQDAV